MFRLSSIDDFAVCDWKVSAEGAADECANASEEKGAASAGQGAVAIAGTHRGSDASANRGSGSHVGRIAVFKAHFAYLLTLVHALR